MSQFEQISTVSTRQINGLVENAKAEALKQSSWISDFEVGIEIVDQQHQMLFQLIAAVKLLKDSNKSSKAVKMVLEELNDYTITHFRDEEALFDAEGWPGAAKHKQTHEFFCAKISEIIEDFSKKGVSVLNDEFLDFLTSWLRVHVTKDDREHSNWYLACEKMRKERKCCTIM
eukprot:TRINITY_DN2352_c0_g1_i2.p1 TRINITY_DN2352_c0_g1~~TRINITY_DN2352_c0_g1_i2.p1  ORF type:complete len:173 (+),score=37.46 TRINITY_DN2352_c0_g1_i2:64-582(+)